MQAAIAIEDQTISNIVRVVLFLVERFVEIIRLRRDNRIKELQRQLAEHENHIKGLERRQEIDVNRAFFAGVVLTVLFIGAYALFARELS